MTELLYTVRRIHDRAVDMAVFEDGAEVARDTYRINGSKCWCPSNKARCKHLDILDRFNQEAPSGDYTGLVYDFNTDTFTRLFGQEPQG